MLNGVKHLIYYKHIEEDPSFLRMTNFNIKSVKSPSQTSYQNDKTYQNDRFLNRHKNDVCLVIYLLNKVLSK